MYERGIKGWLKHFDFILLDMLSLALALFAAFSLRFSQAWGSYQTELYRELLVMLMLLDFTVCVMFNTMHDVLRRGMYQEMLESVKHAAIVFAVMTVLLVALKISNSYSRIILYGTSALHMVLGCALRQIYKKLLQKRIKHEKRRAVLIVAPEARAAEVAQMLLTTANDAFDLAGLVLSDRDAQGETLNGIPVVANLSDAAEYICREWVDEVFIEADAIKAAKKLALSSVPCVIADELTEEQIKAFRLVDNKVGELAEWDVDLLPLELADIAQDLSPFGFETISEDEFGEEFTLDSGEKKPYQQISLTLHDKQAELILACIDYVHTHGEVKETFGNENHKGNGVYEVVRQWAEQKKLV